MREEEEKGGWGGRECRLHRVFDYIGHLELTSRSNYCPLICQIGVCRTSKKCLLLVYTTLILKSGGKKNSQPHTYTHILQEFIFILRQFSSTQIFLPQQIKKRSNKIVLEVV